MFEDKIVDLDELAGICARLRTEGKKIVQCHGCFDLLHPGHIRHFNAAKGYGDVLIVTVTPDRFVDKGPGRPAFNERLRMESLASLGFVDYVALNRWKTAIDTIRLLKPSFYVKGSDYSDPGRDLTANIVKEEDAVRECGGEVRFTDEISFSSSRLINEHLGVLPEEAREYLLDFKKKHTSDEIVQTLKGLSDLNVLVIGDVIIDEYAYCVASGRPEKSPVISAVYRDSETFAGGSLAIANHIAGFVNRVNLLTTIGTGPDNREEFISRHLKPNVAAHLFRRPETPTIVKKRYIEKFYGVKLFEISEIDDSPISRELEHQIASEVEAIVRDIKPDMMVMADFGHGLMTPGLIQRLTATGVFRAVNAQTNSLNYGFNPITRYCNVDYISIDERELRLPYRDRFDDVAVLAERLGRDTNCPRVMITLGSQGSAYYCNGKEFFAPAFADVIVDAIGAGDAVLSVTSLLACRDVDPHIIPFVGNAVGALAVRIVGNRADKVDPVRLFTFIKSLLA